MDNVTCTVTSWASSGVPLTVVCDGQAFVEASTLLSPSDGLFWGYVGVSIALVILGGTMSGLTIGLVALDPNSVRVLATSGEPKEQVRARRILPLVERHHLLLVTLLLSNAIAMEALPIVLGQIAPPAVAVVISVTVVLIFGEIVPQAICTRYGLAVGANLAYLVWVLIVLLSPIAWPLSKLLDWMFGESHSVYYRRNELQELIKLHQNDTDDNEEPLTKDEVKMIRGALDLANKTVQDQMKPNATVLMVPYDAHVDGELLQELVRYGYSRVPVYQGTRHKIVGVLLLKTLVGHEALLHGAPACVADLPLQPAIVLPPATPLWDALHRFLAERSNLAVVQDVSIPDRPVLGIITLEDILVDLVHIHDALTDPLLPRVVISVDEPLSSTALSNLAASPSTASVTTARTGLASPPPLAPGEAAAGVRPPQTKTPPHPMMHRTISIDIAGNGRAHIAARRSMTANETAHSGANSGATAKRPPPMEFSPSGNLGLVPTAVIRFRGAAGLVASPSMEALGISQSLTNAAAVAVSAAAPAASGHAVHHHRLGTDDLRRIALVHGGASAPEARPSPDGLPPAAASPTPNTLDVVRPHEPPATVPDTVVRPASAGAVLDNVEKPASEASPAAADGVPDGPRSA